MVLSRPPWSVFLANFAQNPTLESKQLRDADVSLSNNPMKAILNVVWIIKNKKNEKKKNG